MTPMTLKSSLGQRSRSPSDQGRIQEFGKGRRTFLPPSLSFPFLPFLLLLSLSLSFPLPFSSPSFPFLSLSFPPLSSPSLPFPCPSPFPPPLEVRPLKFSYRVWGSVASPSRNRIWRILAFKCDIWWLQFQ